MKKVIEHIITLLVLTVIEFMAHIKIEKLGKLNFHIVRLSYNLIEQVFMENNKNSKSAFLVGVPNFIGLVFDSEYVKFTENSIEQDLPAEILERISAKNIIRFFMLVALFANPMIRMMIVKIPFIYRIVVTSLLTYMTSFNYIRVIESHTV